MKGVVKQFCEDVRGHDLYEWERDHFSDVLKTSCRSCGAAVIVREDAMPGDKNADGKAIRDGCDM